MPELTCCQLSAREQISMGENMLFKYLASRTSFLPSGRAPEVYRRSNRPFGVKNARSVMTLPQQHAAS
ncbi:hypothetical protein FKM82_003217 [Ascaphus truei]